MKGVRGQRGACPVCGKTVGRKEMKFCSQECFTEYRRRNKVQNTDIRICKNCGKEFPKPRNTAGIFCSNQCYHEWLKKNAAKRVQTCENCGGPFKAKIEQKRGHIYHRKFCTRTCYRAYHEKNKVTSICPVCGTVFKQGGNQKIYCSQECHRKGRPQSKTPRTCRRALKKHHEDLKHDPQRLTTKFMAKLIGCACPKANGGA